MNAHSGNLKGRQNLLQANNIVSGYGDLQVLKEVSVVFGDEICCVFGPNGSGKSTLLKSINGLVPVWSGTVSINGADITNSTPHEIIKKGIATIPQEKGVFPNLTVSENLKLSSYAVQNGLVMKDTSRAARDIETVNQMFPDLRDKMDIRAKNLSGGQRMMLSIARAMMTNAEVFLFDEPSAGLSPKLVDDVLEMIENLAKGEKSILLIEQNVRKALAIADKVYVMAEGRIQFSGDPEDLRSEDDIMELYLGI